MANIRPEDLAAAIGHELTIYHEDVIASVDTESQQAVKDLVKLTKSTAPKGARGSFRRSISSKLLKRTNHGSTYVWYVKAPDYRLTHLIVHGYAKKGGGRTKSNPFLQNALNRVLPQYEEKIKEAIQNGRS